VPGVKSVGCCTKKNARKDCDFCQNQRKFKDGKGEWHPALTSAIASALTNAPTNAPTNALTNANAAAAAAAPATAGRAVLYGSAAR